MFPYFFALLISVLSGLCWLTFSGAATMLALSFLIITCTGPIYWGALVFVFLLANLVSVFQTTREQNVFAEKRWASRRLATS